MALSSGPANPVPELRVAAGVATLLVFDAPLDRGSLVLEGRERFRLVDAGDRALVLEPALDLGPGERLGLRVRYAGSATPEQAGFTLTTHASEVDTRVEVFRRNDSVDLLRAELVDLRAQLKAQTEENQKLREVRNASRPVGLIMSGMLDYRGVRGFRAKVATERGFAAPLKVVSATSFRAPKWAAIGVKVFNNGTTPWIPSAARVVSLKSGTVVRVLGVQSDLPQIGPGETGVVVIETDVPSWPSGELCRLEFLDSNGTPLTSVSGIVF
ncbi:hypothetical protein WA016_06381 [Myxococcus stipitatus]